MRMWMRKMKHRDTNTTKRKLNKKILTTLNNVQEIFLDTSIYIHRLCVIISFLSFFSRGNILYVATVPTQQKKIQK